MEMKFLIICLSFLIFVNSLSLPSNIDLCHKSDKNFNECLRINIVNGLKKFAEGNEALGISKLEPFYIKSVTIENNKGTSTNLEQIYNNLYLHGLTNFSADNVHVDLLNNNCKFEYNFYLPMLDMLADYQLKGNLLIFAINGRGKCKVTLHNLNVSHDITCERYTKSNGKIHLKITDYKMIMTPNNVEYNFTNLISDNQQLHDQIIKTVNENNLEVFRDIKSGFEKTFAIIYKNTMNNLFSKIPEQDLFLD